MKVEEAKRIADDALEKLAAALERGESQTLKSYLAAMGRFHRYSLGNQLLIAIQRPDATRVAGFWAWKRLGRSVRKGERGIAILAPIVRRGRKADEQRDSEAQRDEPEAVVAFRAAHVFDVDQTDGEPLPEFASVNGDPDEFLSRLRRFVADRGIQLEYRAYLGGAEGVSKGGTIVLLSGHSPAEEFSVLAHEMAHELLHRDGLHRSRTVKETEAEAVAFVVGYAIGLENGTHASDYLQLYQGDVKALAASLNRIRDTATEIIEAIQVEKPELQVVAQAA